MSSGIVLVVNGKLWNTNVEVHFIRTDKYDRGIVFLKGQPINLSREIRQLLGIAELGSSPEDWILTPEAEIDLVHPKNTNGFILGTQLGPVRLEYVNGSLDANKKGNAIYVKTDIGTILSAIPGFQRDWISGEIELGVVSGSSFRAISDSGDLSFEQVQKGLYLKAAIEINGSKVRLFPDEEVPKEITKTSGAPDPQKESKEIAIYRSFGGIQLHKAAYHLDKEKLVVLLHAGLTLGPLTLDFIDLGTEINLHTLMKEPLNAFSFRLYGLGLNVNKGPLQIAGLFVKNPSKEEYSGGVLIKTRIFSLTAFGMYSKEEDYHSLFGFLCLNANIGGAPAFFVTGISICFGYNREIIIPPIEKLADFPLVRYAMDSGSAPSFNAPKSSENPLVIFNKNMGGYIPPKNGSFFFGIGVKFNTYKVLDTVILLILATGEDLEFHLLGLSRLALPAGQTFRPLVFIEISLRASYSVERGLLQIEGQLTDQSYLFSRDVKLSGGFAFYAWFKDQNTAKAGDFVLTAGGYPPHFKKPAHYPDVPRIGFEWRIGSELFVSGKMYMALTPAAIMAGAAFQAVWKSGCLSAVFSFLADFIIQWKPFRYDACIDVTIQASFTVSKWGISKSFSLDIGANLHIWGPEFSGTAELHARVWGIGVSYDISFGNASQQAKLISWSDFKASFLPSHALAVNPPATTEIISIQVTGGFLGEMNDAVRNDKVLLVNPKEFVLSMNSLIPVTHFLPALSGCNILHSTFCIPTTGYKGVKSQLIIEFMDEQGKSCLDDFLFTPTVKNMPRAVWNDSIQTDALSGDQTIPMITGLSVITKPGQTKNNKRNVVKNFRYDTTEVLIREEDELSEESTYTDFFVFEDQYLLEDFLQITDKDVEEYRDYYGEAF